ncbi:hypothetical protein HDE_10877 [Halotydeus destructor]|nr:hypothetical protein HDE_10877 [Halotydeus destructor]
MEDFGYNPRINVKTSSDVKVKLFRITATSPDVLYFGELTETTIEISYYVADCAMNAEGQWFQLYSNIDGPYVCIVQDWYGLYHINETVDDCQTPDTPLHAILESTSRSENTLTPVFSCIEGYRLKPSRQSPTCEENGDWTMYDFQPCEEVFCDKDVTVLEVVSLDQPAASGSRFPIGTKAFLSCSTLIDKRYVVCAENGAWLPKTKPCETPFFRTDNLLIGLAVFIVLVIIGFFWLYRRTRNVSPVSAIPMKHFETSTRKVNQYANHSEYDDSLQDESANYESISYEAATETDFTA